MSQSDSPVGLIIMASGTPQQGDQAASPARYISTQAEWPALREKNAAKYDYIDAEIQRLLSLQDFEKFWSLQLTHLKKRPLWVQNRADLDQAEERISYYIDETKATKKCILEAALENDWPPSPLSSILSQDGFHPETQTPVESQPIDCPLFTQSCGW